MSSRRGGVGSRSKARPSFRPRRPWVRLCRLAIRSAASASMPRMRFVVLLASPAAQQRYWPTRSRRLDGGHDDYDRALDIAIFVNGSPEAAEAYLNWLAVVARDEIDGSWDSVETVAEALIERRTLDAAEIAALLS